MYFAKCGIPHHETVTSQPKERTDTKDPSKRKGFDDCVWREELTNVPYTEAPHVVSVAVYRGQPDPKENTLIGRAEVQPKSESSRSFTAYKLVDPRGKEMETEVRVSIPARTVVDK